MRCMRSAMSWPGTIPLFIPKSASIPPQTCKAEMIVIVIIAAIIIVLVLTLTSRSYAEVPVLIMTFGAAALLNMGTNFLCGTISFISNSVTVILQLALAIDYAIILCHRFSDEHETMPTREACIAAFQGDPGDFSSSLTTISGLAALAFMHFGIGRDLATVLIKAILFSMLCVFTLMPGLLVLFSKLIDKTRHKNLIPKITAVGKFDIKTRFIIPPIFGVIIVARSVRQPVPLLLHLHRSGHRQAERAPDRLPENQKHLRYQQHGSRHRAVRRL